jgi:pimeloyl-ACP methyl ester carboxylesterase
MVIGISTTDYRLPLTDYLLTIHLVVFLLFGFLSTRAQSDQHINSSEAIEIGGIKQWINIKGTNNKNPILLFLHGGPGNSVMGYAEKFTNELQKHFVVVQWDQRESGKTVELNASDKPLSVSLMESDALELIYYLRMRFSQDKIYLMGHSWGGFLGLSLAANHPELLNGYFAISPMVYQVKSERLSLDWMVGKAKESDNQKALRDLAQIKIPFENPEQLYFHRTWLAQLMDKKPLSKSFVEAWGNKWLALFNEASQVNFFTYAPELKCPVYFFIGAKDYQTYFKLTEDYYNMLKADKKRLFWFKDSGHNLNVAEPKKLQEIIISELDK